MRTAVAGAKPCVHQLLVCRGSGIERSGVYGHCSNVRKMHLAPVIQDCWQSQSGPCFERRHGKYKDMSLYQSGGDRVKVFGLAL